MPEHDMTEREKKFGRSDELQPPQIDKERFPGVMEAGKKGAGGGTKVENWQKFVDAANKLPEGKARHGLYDHAREALTTELNRAVLSGDDKRIAEIAEKLDEVYGLMETGSAGQKKETKPGEVGNKNTETVRVEIPEDEKELKIFLENIKA